MSQKVWCVFQRLPGESCPALSAVCASRAAADELVRISAGDEEEQGRPRSAWTVSAWGVLEDAAGIADAQQLSDVLDPLREGAIPLDETQEEDAPAVGAGGRDG